MEIVTLSGDQIAGLSNTFLFPLLYFCGSIFIVFWLFPVLWGKAKARFSLIKLSGIREFAIILFIAIVLIYMYGRIFSFLSNFITGYVSVDQPNLMLYINSSGNSLATLWSFYPSIYAFGDFTSLIIHDVSVLSASIPSSYYSEKYFEIRNLINNLVLLSSMSKTFIAITIIATFIDYIRCSVCFVRINRFRLKRKHITRYFWNYLFNIIRHIQIFRFFILILLFSATFIVSNCYLIESLCLQASCRCNALLTFKLSELETRLDNDKIDLYQRKIDNELDLLDKRSIINTDPSYIMRALEINLISNYFPNASRLYKESNEFIVQQYN